MKSQIEFAVTITLLALAGLGLMRLAWSHLEAATLFFCSPGLLLAMFPMAARIVLGRKQ